MEALQLMNEKHCEILLSNFKLGTRIKFEHHLKLYQRSLSINVDELPKIVCNNDNQSADDIKIKLKNQTFQLENILKNYTQGSLIVDYYKKHNILNESCRNLFVEIIINYIIKYNISMTINLANSIANEIIKVFPSEIKVNIFSW